MPMEMQAESSPLRPRVVAAVGWTWLIIAALRFAEGLVGLVVWKVGGVEDLLPHLRIGSGDARNLLANDPSVRYATEIMVAQTLLAGFLAYAGFALLRLKNWAKTTILAASCIGIVLAAGLGVFIYATTARAAAATPEAAATIRIAGAATGVLVAMIGIAFFGGTIFLLRRPAAASAFERSA
jgi:hypothetical protein